ncbi:MAG TPA: YbdD/YjiX family protein [Gemmatimonadales bacterium]|nr:YbdD/YjiX family protein [Gemmatimonadales bacterium]
MRNSGRQDGRTAGRLVAFLSLLKRVCGMPDYHGYLAHMREKHGGCAVLSEREYFEQHMQVRYGSGVSRCC